MRRKADLIPLATRKQQLAEKFNFKIINHSTYPDFLNEKEFNMYQT